MWFNQWYRDWRNQPRTRRTLTSRPSPLRHAPLRLEQLEDRTLPSNFFAATVSDLIADIKAANNAGGSNTITLAANQTFKIDQVNNTTDGGNGLPVITLNDNLTIVGNGDTIGRTSNTAFRFFDVGSGASLTLLNLTLKNGQATTGGAALNYGTLTVSGCTLSANSAFAAGFGQGSGGGIANYGTLTVNCSTLTGNSASSQFGDAGQGGGIFNDGKATVQNSTLDHNTAQSTGGGIDDVLSATLTITGSTLSKNSASAGGGIYDNSSNLLTISNSVVCNNSAGPSGDLFEGVDSPVLITNSTVCVIYIAAP
jgi:hypothetical protein